MTLQTASRQHIPHFVHAEFYPFDEETTLVIAPNGEQYLVDFSVADIQAALQQCDGSKTADEIVSTLVDAEKFAEILDVLAEANCLSFLPPINNEQDWSRFVGFDQVTCASRVNSTHLILLGDDALLQEAQGLGFSERFASVTTAQQGHLSSAVDALGRSNLVIVALQTHLDTAFLAWLDRFCCEAEDLRWAQFHFDQGLGWLGPAITPGHTASYSDLLQRRAAAAESRDLHQSLTAAPNNLSSLQLLSQHETQWMLSFFFAQIERWVAGLPCPLDGVEICANPLTLALQAYPVLPFPNRLLKNEVRVNAPKDFSLLINNRSGIFTDILELQRHPSIPRVFKTTQIRLAQNPAWLNDPLSMTSFFDERERFAPRPSRTQPAEAQTNPLRLPPQTSQSLPDARVLLDAAKYYADSNFYHAQATLSTYADLLARGEQALNPEVLVLLSENTYRAPGCPFVPFTQRTPAYWVKGHSLTGSNQRVWLPADMVYVNWQLADFVKEPVPATHLPNYAGLGTGFSLEDALLAAIEDVIRRDSMMVWWMNAHPLPSIIQPDALKQIWAEAQANFGQNARLMYLPNEFGLPILVGVLENTQEKLLTLGFGYGSDPLQAALQAWAEAATSQEASRDLNDPQGLTRQSVEQGLMYNAFKPWRADRAYLDDYRPDFRDANDPMSQRQVYLDPRAIERVRPWIETPATLHLDEIPSQANRSLAAYQQKIEARGFQIYWMDLTPSDLALIGVRVVRVLIPGLVPNFPASFPLLGNGRIQNAAVQLGWRTQPLAEEDLNYMPLPGA